MKKLPGAIPCWGLGIFSLLLIFSSSVRSSAASEPVRLEPVVVTSTRVEEPAGEVTDSVTIILPEDIEVGAAPLVIDELRRVPGVQVQRSGTIGEQTIVRFRGSEKNHCLILYNGIRLNSAYDRVGDLGDFVALSLDRVEVVRGTFSALYGSDAIGGVINIIPLPGRSLRESGEQKLRVSLMAEGGSMSTLRESLNVVSRGDIHSLSVGASRIDTAGQNERDGFFGNFASASGKILVPGGGEVGVSAVFSNSEKEVYLDVPLSLYIQNMVLTLVRDSNYSVSRETVLAGLTFRQPLADLAELSFNGSALWGSLDFNNPTDPGWPDYNVSEISTARRSAGLLFQLKPVEQNAVLVGAEYSEEEAEENMETNLPTGGMGPIEEFFIEGKRFERALFIEDRTKIGGVFFLNAGVRFDYSSDVPGGDVFISPRGSAAAVLQDWGTKIRGGVGRGYRTPSVNERFFPMKGNPALEPEEAWSYEAGVEQEFERYGIVMNATFFYLDFQNVVGMVPGEVQLQNAEEARSFGIEAGVSCRPLEWLSLRAGYTFDDAEKKTMIMTAPGVFEERWVDFFWRPAHSLSASIEAGPVSGLRVRLTGEYQGEYHEPHDITDEPYDYLDPDGNIIGGDNPGFTLFNLYSEYRIPYRVSPLESVSVFMRLENVFNADYYELKGYPSPGISAYGGLRLNI